MWTTNGYYTYIYLAEASFIKPVDDPYSVIAGYNEKARVYPKKLKESIINEFLGRSAMWLDSFHYESAIEREDIMFIGSIVKNTVLDMVQVIYALNEVYFTGDKKLEKQLSKLDYCPKLLLSNVELLFSAPKDKEKLKSQREILRKIYKELSDKAK